MTRAPLPARPALALSVLFASVAVADDPHADTVVAYDAGSNPAAGYTDPMTALGAPERETGELIGFPGVVSPFNSPFGTDEIVSVGAGGHLVLRFDTPVTDDPANPFGVDLLVFGNTFFLDDAYPAGIVGGAAVEGGTIEVSADGASWTPVVGVVADGLFPTLGWLDAGPYDVEPGRVPADFTRPVDPAIHLDDLMGLHHAQVVDAYAGSGGGAGVDLADTGLDAISFIRIAVAADAPFNIEIDAVADVAPAGALPADIDGDGAVDGADLGILLAAWGAILAAHPADLDGNGVVDGSDLGLLLGAWT